MAVINTDNMKADKNNVPQCGFTQRATIDCDRDEIYVLSVNIESIAKLTVFTLILI